MMQPLKVLKDRAEALWQRLEPSVAQELALIVHELTSWIEKRFPESDELEAELTPVDKHIKASKK